MNPLQFFKCLSDDTRLKSVLIVSTLEEACVCDL
ncbi:MAG: transcriptional regulator, partial [Idiomarina sp.]|nr:transcriptional regulator [Idiomarina sp.]